MFKNNKGFSLIELLAVIVILSLLLLIGINAVTPLINKSHTELMERQKDTLIMATRNLIETNRDMAPKSIGQTVKIDASTLKNKKFLKDDIINGKKQVCMSGTYVTVTKVKKNKFSYSVYVKCPGDGTILGTHNDGPMPSFSLETVGGEKVIKFSINPNGNVIASYFYSISVKTNTDTDYVNVYNSGTIPVDVGSASYNGQVKLKDCIDLKNVRSIKVIFRSTSTDGKSVDTEHTFNI